MDELVAENGVSTKTIRRDLSRLSSAGFPITASVVGNGRKLWRLDADGYTGTGLAFDEAFVMLLAADALRSFSGTSLGEALDGAIEKLRSGLSKHVVGYCDRLSKSIRLHRQTRVRYEEHSDILDQLLLSHEDQKTVQIAYHSRQSAEPVNHLISPYAIRLYRDAIYVIARSEEQAEIRLFKLDRICSAEVTDVPFLIPESFNAEEYLKSAFGVYVGDQTRQVRIRFAARAARPLSEKRWHPTQRLDPQRDGSVIASFEVALTPELVGWVLSIGRDAIVLEPDELIQRVQAEATAICDHYRKAIS